MKKLLPIFLLFCSVVARAGAHYTYGTHSGSVVITAASNSPSLVGGDTLVITGTFTDISFHTADGAGTNIVFDLRGATITTASFQQNRWYDLHYVKILGGYWHNYYGTIYYSYLIDHLTHEGSRWVNDAGNYIAQPIWLWDDAFASVSMVFTGSKSQTFFNNTYYLCEVNGFINCTPIIFGAAWNGSGTDKRSIFLDGLIDSCTFKNCTNTGGTGMNAIYGTGWKMTIKRSTFDSTAEYANGGGGAHIADVFWRGTIDFYSNHCSTSYASALRTSPLAWTGLPGYIGNGTASRAYNNIARNQESYSPFEFTQNGLGNLTSGNGVYPCKWFCESNTVFGTVRHSYNGDYYGFVVDVVNCDSGTIINNFIMLPEKDRTYDLAGRGYIWAQISAAPAQQTVSHNVVAQVFNTAYVTDSINYYPTASGPLDATGIASSFRTLDINGRTVAATPSVGAVERITVVSPPSCTTNILPTAGSTVAGTTTAGLSWNAASGATFYDVFGPYLGGTPPGSPTYSAVTGTSMTATGLIAGTVYHYYVRPGNTGGSATGCSTSNTQFSTHAVGVSSGKKILIRRR